MARLIELANVLRSKNAGPLFVTFDVMFDRKEAYNRVINSGALNKDTIARLYHTDEDSVEIVDYPAASAIKITIPRRIVSGDIGDTDIYGAQQHAPLLDIEIA